MNVILCYSCCKTINTLLECRITDASDNNYSSLMFEEFCGIEYL